MLNELLKLVNYKSWANEVTFSALSKISDVELFKPRDTNFKNIPSTLNHAYVVDDIFKSHLLQMLIQMKQCQKDGKFQKYSN